MNVAPLQGKQVTVMGLGLHGGGLGTVQWLVNQGAIVTVTDMKTEAELATSLEKLKALGGEVRLVLGEHREVDFVEADVVIRNPSVRADSEFLMLARASGVPVEMDSSLFFAYCPTNDIIGITGSKGKTTCSRAIEHVLMACNKKVVAVGVDGVSPLGMLAEEKITENTTVVFELSSWRLEALAERKISPAVAVVTSIYREHLNTYSSFEDYIETKKAIWRAQGEQGMVILNADDIEIRSWVKEVPGRLYWYSMGGEISGEGIFVRDEMVWVREKNDETALMSIDDLPVQHEHERRNLLPALLLGWQRGLRGEQLKMTINTFRSLPHRLELVRKVDEVVYVNDSAATMPDAAMAALRAYESSPVVLIAGGNDKALSFSEWAQDVLKSSVKTIVWLPGTITGHMQEEVRAVGCDIPFVEASSMQEAVEKAADMAERGEVVLLSPGATSFGLFQNEFDRGDQFREAVRKL